MSNILSKVTSVLASDPVFFVVLFAIFFLLVAYLGRNRMASFIIIFYPAVLLYKSFPFLQKLVFIGGDRGEVLSNLLVFLGFLILTYFALQKYLFSFKESSGILNKAGVSLALLLVFMYFTNSVINLDFIHDFSGSIDTIFAGKGGGFGSALAPLALLAFF